MTQHSNAGIRRVRRARGLPVRIRQIRQIPSTADVYDAAAAESGNLSMSLYLERLSHFLVAEYGSLPVLPDAADQQEGRRTTAA